jgi:hypothetical protein
MGIQVGHKNNIIHTFKHWVGWETQRVDIVS